MAERLTFQYHSPGCWVTENWTLMLELVCEGWRVREPGHRTIKDGFATKEEAREWAQGWIDGRYRP